MPPLLGFDQLPAPVAEQLHRVVKLWKKQLPGELVGIYLHGSIALRAFRPESGDLDVLAVVKNSLSTKRRLALAAEMIKLDGQPCPLECPQYGFAICIPGKRRETAFFITAIIGGNVIRSVSPTRQRNAMWSIRTSPTRM